VLRNARVFKATGSASQPAADIEAGLIGTDPDDGRGE
jgi:hypothetical protein